MTKKQSLPKGLQRFLTPAHILLAVILLVALIGRVYQVGDHSFWGDEPQVYVAAENILETGIPYLHSGYYYTRDLPHLYLSAATMFLFGYTEFALRIISVLAGTALVYLGYVLTLKISTRRAAFLAAVVIALHPWLISFSRIGRSYILMAAMVVLTVYWSIRYYESEWKLKYGIGTALMGALALLTHQTGQTALLIVVPSFVMTVLYRRGDSIREFVVNAFKAVWPYVFIGSGIFVGRYFTALAYYNYSDQRIELLHDTSLLKRLSSLVPLELPPHMEYMFYVQYSIPVFFALALFFIVLRLFTFKKIKESQQFFLITLITFFAILLFSRKAVNINRGVLYIAPYLLIAGSVLIDSVVRRWDKYKTVLIGIVALGIAIPYSFQSWNIVTATYGEPIPPEYSFFEGWPYRLDMQTTFEYVAENYQEGDQIIVMGNPKFAVAYFPDDLVPDYYVGTNNPRTVNGGYHYVIETKLIDTLAELQRTKRQKNTWIITTYSTGNLDRINHLTAGIRKWITAQEEYKQYQSADPWARVYYFPESATIVE